MLGIGDRTRAIPRRYIRVFEVCADGRRLSGGKVFHKIAPGWCDGLRIDEDGNLKLAAAQVRFLSAGTVMLDAGRSAVSIRDPDGHALLVLGHRGDSG